MTGTARFYLGLSSAFGGLLAALSDILQKDQASAVMKIHYSLRTTLGAPSNPLLVVGMLVGFGVALCFIFGADSNKRAFYIGASIPSILMTLVPYKPVPNLPSDPGHLANSVAPPAHLARKLLDPWVVLAQSTQELKSGLRVEVHLQTSDHQPVAQAVFSLTQAGSERIIGRSTVKGADFAFYVVPGTYGLTVEVAGYRIVRFFVSAGSTTAWYVTLVPTSIPLQIQRILIPPTQQVVGYSFAKLKLSEIEAVQDGGWGATRWGFDLFAGERLLFSVPDRPYDDRASPPWYRMDDKAEARIQISIFETAPLRLRVVGHRPPQAEGEVTVPLESVTTSAQSLAPLHVSVASNPRAGDFQFHFALSREAEQNPAGTTGVTVRLDEIVVKEDGGVGSANWSFDVFGGENLLFTLPEKAYNDKTSPRYSPQSDGKSSGDVEVAGETVRIRVRGHHPPQAEGSAAIRSIESGSSIGTVIPVRVPEDQRKGDFNFRVLRKPD